MGNLHSIDCSDVVEEQYIITRAARDVFRRSLKAYKTLCQEKDGLLANISRKLADKERENRSLKAELYEVKRALAKAEHANFKVLYRDVLREVGKHKSMLAGVQRERDDFARQFEATTEEGNSLRAKITEQSASISRMTTRIAALEVQHSTPAGEVPQRLNDETERSRQATTAHEELQRKLARLSADRITAFGQLKEKDNQIANLKQENDDLRAEVQLEKSRHADEEKKTLTSIKPAVLSPRVPQEHMDLNQVTAEAEARFAEREMSARTKMADEFEALFQARLANLQAELLAEAEKSTSAIQTESAAKDKSHEEALRAMSEQSAQIQALNEKLTDELRKCRSDLEGEVTKRQTAEHERESLAELEVELQRAQSELRESKEIAMRAKSQAEDLTAQVRDSQIAAESTAKQMEATKSHLLEHEKITTLAHQENQGLRSQLEETRAALEALSQESKKDSPLMPSSQDSVVQSETLGSLFTNGSKTELQAHIVSQDHPPASSQEMEVTESPSNAISEIHHIDIDAEGSEDLEFEDVDMVRSSVAPPCEQSGEPECLTDAGLLYAQAPPEFLDEQATVDLDMENSNLDMKNSNEVAGVPPAPFPHEQSNVEFAKNLNTFNFLNLDVGRSEPAGSVNPFLALLGSTHVSTVQEAAEIGMPPIEEFDFEDFLWGERPNNETKPEDAATEVATEVGAEWDIGEAATILDDLVNDREAKKRRVRDISVKSGSPLYAGEEEAKFAEHDAAGDDTLRADVS